MSKKLNASISKRIFILFNPFHPDCKKVFPFSFYKFLGLFSYIFKAQARSLCKIHIFLYA